NVAWPAGRHVIAVTHDESRSVIVDPVADQPATLAAGMSDVSRDIQEILGPRQRSCHFLLNRHVAARLTVPLAVGAVILRIPKPADARERPRGFFQRPG